MEGLLQTEAQRASALSVQRRADGLEKYQLQSLVFLGRKRGLKFKRSSWTGGSQEKLGAAPSQE